MHVYVCGIVAVAAAEAVGRGRCRVVPPDSESWRGPCHAMYMYALNMYKYHVCEHFDGLSSGTGFPICHPQNLLVHNKVPLELKTKKRLIQFSER